MCDTCGCNENGKDIVILKPGEEHDAEGHSHTHDDHSHHHHDHPHEHTHDHVHDHTETEGRGTGRLVKVEQDILGSNNLLAERNRGYFEARNITSVNLMSSPGSGKTTLLEKTIRLLNKDKSVYVIEGDQQTLNDAYRIESAGAPVVQVNTGNGCHLDAEMINRAVKKLDIVTGSVLFIENVGNLVCPSLFDLGESKRVVIISVTEGEDKPAKYPTIFENASLCIINKTDLLPYVDFNVEKTKEYALRINHELEFIELSARTEEGLEKWLEWLRNLQK
ncbi:MAG TPA: hydrogenase nickel incorporation protein HypB [Bacteroidales bacterium]|nr:hydrogenase nickel incorporation protein HypB [Bacteroidales bacterium]